MSRAAWIAPLGLVVLAVAWGFGRLVPSEPDPRSSRAPSRRRPALVRAPQAAPPATPAAGAGADGVVWRDLFAYAEESAPRAAVDSGPIAELVTPAPTPTPTPAPSLRWIGLVRQGGTLRAALSDHGVVVVVGAGDSVDGRLVAAVDADRGVRLRARDGHEEWLAPAR